MKKQTVENKQALDFMAMESFEDLCKVENIDPTQLPGVDNLPEKLREPLIAAYKIMVGVSAANEGWEPDYTNIEPKYFPWAEVKHSSSGSGVVFSSSDYSSSSSDTAVGSRLVTKKSERTRHLFNILNKCYFTWLVK